MALWLYGSMFDYVCVQAILPASILGVGNHVYSTCLQRVLRMCSDMFRLFLSVQGVDEGSWIRVSDELYLPKECLGAELETS